MTTLFEYKFSGFVSTGIAIPNFNFNSVVYTTLYVSSSGWLSFNTSKTDPPPYGQNPQTPVDTFRFFFNRC